jgi:hypothetical protein
MDCVLTDVFAQTGLSHDTVVVKYQDTEIGAGKDQSSGNRQGGLYWYGIHHSQRTFDQGFVTLRIKAINQGVSVFRSV